MIKDSGETAVKHDSVRTTSAIHQPQEKYVVNIIIPHHTIIKITTLKFLLSILTLRFVFTRLLLYGYKNTWSFDLKLVTHGMKCLHTMVFLPIQCLCSGLKEICNNRIVNVKWRSVVSTRDIFVNCIVPFKSDFVLLLHCLQPSCYAISQNAEGLPTCIPQEH